MPARIWMRRSTSRRPAPRAEKIPADTLVVPLAVVDVAAKAAQNPDYLLTREDLAAWEKKHRRLPDNCCVAMHSGWAQHVGNAAKYTGKDGAGVFHFPGVAPQAAEWLMKERKVLGLAVDTLSLDHGPSKDFKVHYAWLPSGRWGLENVANLDKVPAVRRDAGGGPGESEGRDRRARAADRAGLTRGLSTVRGWLRHALPDRACADRRPRSIATPCRPKEARLAVSATPGPLPQLGTRDDLWVGYDSNIFVDYI